MNDRGEISFLTIGQAALVLLGLGIYYSGGIYPVFSQIFGSVFANVIGIATIIILVWVLGRQEPAAYNTFGGPSP